MYNDKSFCAKEEIIEFKGKVEIVVTKAEEIVAL
jgi:hypothetical protein